MSKPEGIEVSDTYEAAFYLLNGATLISVRKTPVPSREIQRYLFTWRWYIRMGDVSMGHMAEWRGGTAVANIRQLAAARKKIKRFVKNYVE